MSWTKTSNAAARDGLATISVVATNEAGQERFRWSLDPLGYGDPQDVIDLGAARFVTEPLNGKARERGADVAGALTLDQAMAIAAVGPPDQEEK